MVRPLNQFCCGCTLTFGAKLILLLNLVVNLWYIFTGVTNIILQIPTFGFSTNLTSQTFFSAFCLMGLPFIFSGAWGVYACLENHIRLYWFYQLFAFFVDVVYIIFSFFLTDVCSKIPSALSQHGSAFACGFMRMWSLCFVFLVLITELYFIFCIWSLCEDMKVGGTTVGFTDLLRAKSDGKWSHRTAYSETMVGAGREFGYPNYASFSSPGVGNSRHIYGKYHETQFPPPAHHIG